MCTKRSTTTTTYTSYVLCAMTHMFIIAVNVLHNSFNDNDFNKFAKSWWNSVYKEMH